MCSRPQDRSGQIEPVKIHDLVPRCHKIVQELLLGVLTSVDFRQGPQLGVGAEDQVDPGAGPLEFAAGAITPLEQVVGSRGCLPDRAFEGAIGTRTPTSVTSSSLFSEASEVVYPMTRRCRNGRGSLLYSTLRRSRARTSHGSPHIRRLPPGP